MRDFKNLDRVINFASKAMSPNLKSDYGAQSQKNQGCRYCESAYRGAQTNPVA